MARTLTVSQLGCHPALPRDRSVGIGCIGAGFIMADCHLAAYRAAGLNPVAIASRRAAQARKVAERHDIATVHKTYQHLLDDPAVQVIDIAVPPDAQHEIIREAVKRSHARGGHLRGILAQKPLAGNYKEAKKIVELCEKAKLPLGVNQNMRWDQAVRGCRTLLDRDMLGDPVLATIDMRAIPHWMPWQKRQGWVTCRIMSIHHLDTFRYWFGDPVRIYSSFTKDPRTAKQFDHTDGICLHMLDYSKGLRCSSWDDVWTGPAREGAASDIGIRWRVEGTAGLARGTIGWPKYPRRSPSTLDYSTTKDRGRWHKPRWRSVWFPDAFAGPMAELLCALEEKREPTINGRDNLKTMALVDASYRSAKEHRAVTLKEMMT